MDEWMGENKEASRRKSDKRNEAFFPSNVGIVGETFGVQSKSIYIYNVAPLEHRICRPPNHPHMTILRCPKGESYILTGAIEHPFPQADYDSNGNRRIDYTNGYREATVMLSPENPGTDQNFDKSNGLCKFGNLNNYGVFWSENNPPSEEEVRAARQRMEKTFKEELARLSAIEAKDPQGVSWEANDVSHAAADYFGEVTAWHRSDLVPKKDIGKEPCPNCGELISPSAAVCQHCDAILDEAKAKRFFPDRFPRLVGRPVKVED